MYGWTSQEFDSQPLEFVNAIVEKMKVDAVKKATASK